MAASLHSLLDEIRQAFPLEPKPPADDIVPATTYRDFERESIAQSFTGRRWNEMSPDELRENQESLFLLSPIAFRYYLPAYMSFAVEYFGEADAIPFNVVRSLTGPSLDSDDIEWFQQRVSGLSDAQRKVIRSFLQYLDSHEGETFTGGQIAAALKSV